VLPRPGRKSTANGLRSARSRTAGNTHSPLGGRTTTRDCVQRSPNMRSVRNFPIRSSIPTPAWTTKANRSPAREDISFTSMPESYRPCPCSGTWRYMLMTCCLRVWPLQHRQHHGRPKKEPRWIADRPHPEGSPERYVKLASCTCRRLQPHNALLLPRDGGARRFLQTTLR
jgi:hypothetical protein